MRNPIARRPELILHIGHYKTGTTALQVFLDRNRALLAREGLHYAAVPLFNAKHSALAFSLLREGGATSLLYGFDDPTPARTHWQRLFEATRALPRGRSMLVSSEEFIRFGAYPAAASALKALFAEAPDIRLRVIAYLRPPQAHLRSWYNQLVKLGVPVAGPDATVQGQMETVHRDYAAALAPWIDLAGSGAVILRSYGEHLRAGHALYTDFLDALGLRLPPGAVIPAADPNPRLDERLLPLRRALSRSPLNRQQVDWFMERLREQLLVEEGGRLPADAPGFGAIRDTARAAILSLAALPGARLDTAAMLTDLPAPQPPEQGAAELAVALMTHEIAHLRAAHAHLLGRFEALEARIKAGEGQGR